MTDRTFDPTAWLEAYRDAFAPVHKAQQDGLKTLERFARFQYAVAGDYLESSLAQLQAAVSSKSPAEYLGKQTELGTRLGEKVSGRVHELISLSNEMQGNFAQAANETAARTARKVVAA